MFVKQLHSYIVEAGDLFLLLYAKDPAIPNNLAIIGKKLALNDR